MTDQQKKMINQLDQLDQLDHLEFTAQIDKANACISARDYGCAEKKIAKAAKYAINPHDKNTLRLVKQDLAAERKLEQEERAAAAERARQIRLAEARAEQEEAERRRREQRAEEEASKTDWFKVGATLATGAYIGSVTKNLAPDQQSRMMKASMDAVYNGNTAGLDATANQITAEREQAYNAKMQEIREQKARDERAAERERARAEREEREAKRQRDAERDRVARAEARRAADARRAAETRQVGTTMTPLGSTAPTQTTMSAPRSASSKTATQQEAGSNSMPDAPSYATQAPSSASANASRAAEVRQSPLVASAQVKQEPGQGYRDSFTENWERELARPKYIDSSSAAPGSMEKTEAAARASALESWEGTKRGIESEHNGHVRYGRIVSVGSPKCYPQHDGNGNIRDWICKVPYSVERARQPETPGGVISK